MINQTDLIYSDVIRQFLYEGVRRERLDSHISFELPFSYLIIENYS